MRCRDFFPWGVLVFDGSSGFVFSSSASANPWLRIIKVCPVSIRQFSRTALSAKSLISVKSKRVVYKACVHNPDLPIIRLLPGLRSGE